jgi:Zn-dependent metalloprotease
MEDLRSGPWSRPPSRSSCPGPPTLLRLASIPGSEALAVAAADRIVSAGLGELTRGPEETFVRGDAVAGAGGLHYVAYERTYRGIPVVGGDAVVVTDDRGKVLSVSSAMSRPVAMPPVTVAVRADAAAGLAHALVAGVTSVGAPRQVVLARDTARLAWETVVEGRNGDLPSRLHVFVNAATGAVLDSYDEVRADTGNGFYDGRVTITTTPGRLVDPTRTGLSCGPLSTRQPYTNSGTVWGNGTGTDLKTGCVDAFYAVEKEWDLLKTWLGRNGLNGTGISIRTAGQIYMGALMRKTSGWRYANVRVATLQAAKQLFPGR